MKIAKADEKDVTAILNLMQVLRNSEDEGFPCKPDGTWDEGEAEEWFDPDNRNHLRKFYERVMGCLNDAPGALVRCIGGFHLALTNDVWDPDAESYEWHPTLKAAVVARDAARAAEPQDG